MDNDILEEIQIRLTEIEHIFYVENENTDLGHYYLGKLTQYIDDLKKSENPYEDSVEDNEEDDHE